MDKASSSTAGHCSEAPWWQRRGGLCITRCHRKGLDVWQSRLDEPVPGRRVDMGWCAKSSHGFCSISNPKKTDFGLAKSDQNGDKLLLDLFGLLLRYYFCLFAMLSWWKLIELVEVLSQNPSFQVHLLAHDPQASRRSDWSLHSSVGRVRCSVFFELSRAAAH